MTLASLGFTAGAQAEGFVEDANFSLNLRNFYINRNFVDSDYPQSKGEEWTQSFILNFQSGYTPGPVGFGVDALGLLAVKLDGGGGTYGTGLLPVHGAPGDRHPPDDFARLAVAAKAKFSETEVRVGEWMVVMPILLPVVTSFGVDPVHFGMIMLVNLGIGLITPPVGAVLFVGAAIGKVTIENTVKALLPFYAALFAVLMAVTYIPMISLWLPSVVL